jgi:secreted PhoX family phosphatase
MKGTENGQFARPEGVYVDPSGIVYIADTNNARVQKFASQS